MDRTEALLKELSDLRYQINIKDKELEDLFELKAQKEIELMKVCAHEKTKIVQDFISGDYYNRSQHITSTICETCGTVLDRNTKAGDYA
jgi:hypothetical protein